MDRNNPRVVIEGLEEIIERDLEKHKGFLERSKLELLSYKQAVSHEIKRKKYYKSLIGGGKFNDEALQKSMNDIATNIRHMSDKVKLTNEAIVHHTEIVDTLTVQLKDQMAGLKELYKQRDS